MLTELQQQLASLYRVEHAHDIRDFLITDPAIAQALSHGAMLTNTEETLLVSEDDDGVAMSLFLDAEMLNRLESDNPLDRLHIDHLDDFWKVLEGISHFNCVAWKAGRDRSVSLLELELQGEIDKYVSALLLADLQQNGALLDDLHGWLFEASRLRDDLGVGHDRNGRVAEVFLARGLLGGQFAELRQVFGLFPAATLLFGPATGFGGRLLGTAQCLALAFGFRLECRAFFCFLTRLDDLYRFPRIHAFGVVARFGPVLVAAYDSCLEQDRVFHELTRRARRRLRVAGHERRAERNGSEAPKCRSVGHGQILQPELNSVGGSIPPAPALKTAASSHFC